MNRTIITRNATNSNPNQFDEGSAEWGRETQNALAASIRSSLGGLSDQLNSKAVPVVRGDTLGTIVKAIRGDIDVNQAVDYRSGRLTSKPTTLGEANLIYPGQCVWIENGTIVVADGADTGTTEAAAEATETPEGASDEGVAGEEEPADANEGAAGEEEPADASEGAAGEEEPADASEGAAGEEEPAEDADEVVPPVADPADEPAEDADEVVPPVADPADEPAEDADEVVPPVADPADEPAEDADEVVPPVADPADEPAEDADEVVPPVADDEGVDVDAAADAAVIAAAEAERAAEASDDAPIPVEQIVEQFVQQSPEEQEQYIRSLSEQNTPFSEAQPFFDAAFENALASDSSLGITVLNETLQAYPEHLPVYTALAIQAGNESIKREAHAVIAQALGAEDKLRGIGNIDWEANNTFYPGTSLIPSFTVIPRYTGDLIVDQKGTPWNPTLFTRSELEQYGTHSLQMSQFMNDFKGEIRSNSGAVAAPSEESTTTPAVDPNVPQ